MLPGSISQPAEGPKRFRSCSCLSRSRANFASKRWRWASFPGTETRPAATRQSSLQVFCRNSPLWLTTATPPWKLWMASAKALAVWASRKLVGSSSRSRWGLTHIAAPSMSLLFCPAEKLLSRCVRAMRSDIPNDSRCFTISAEVSGRRDMSAYASRLSSAKHSISTPNNRSLAAISNVLLAGGFPATWHHSTSYRTLPPEPRRPKSRLTSRPLYFWSVGHQ
mmetsp:Transcript_103555/g.322006  ORF Transcript_103555/g.322006 Transcript_103555/m.322006 type:complete len:222 (+) Transcript_103555:314-979(+)